MGTKTESHLAGRLRGLREERGFTQEEVATRLGLSRLSLWAMENGKRSVLAEELYELALFYGRPLEEFFVKEAREEDVVRSLQDYGYPVLLTKGRKGGRRLDPTTLVLCVLSQFPDPRFVEGLPVVFFTQTLNYEWLYREAVRQGLQNRLGLVVEFTLQAFRLLGVTKDWKVLEDLAARLEKVKLSREETLRGEVLQGAALSLHRHFQDSLSQKWNLLTHFPLDTLTRWIARAKKSREAQRV